MCHYKNKKNYKKPAILECCTLLFIYLFKPPECCYLLNNNVKCCNNIPASNRAYDPAATTTHLVDMHARAHTRSPDHGIKK